MKDSKNPVVTIIYVNYNTLELLEDSLCTLVKNIKYIDYEVIVIDNNSKEFKGAGLRKILPNVKIIKSNTNLGFGGGNNTAAQKATGKYLWLLNTDTLVPKDNHIDKVIQFLENNRDYAAASPLLVNEKGKAQTAQIAHFPNIFRMIIEKPVKLTIKLIPFTKPWLKSLNPSFVPTNQCNVDQAVAASLIVRTKDFIKIMGFSKEYFMYYEDTDLCKKFSNIHKKIRFIPESKIIHLLGKSIKNNFERKQIYYDSQDIYFNKWHSRFTMTVMKLLRFPIKMYYKYKT